MSLKSVLSGISSLLHPSRRNAEIDAEVRGLLDAAIAHRMRMGLSRDEAERAARAELGSAEMVRHKVWSAGWESHADSLGKDVRYGMRQIVRSPGLSLVAIVSLALGIGANTAIFTVINDLLLKQLPVRDPHMLVSFGEGTSAGIMASSSPGPYDIFPYEFYRRIQNEHEKLEGICAFASFTNSVSVRADAGTSGAATQAISHLVSGSFFNVLGAQPLMGRVLTDADTVTEGSNAVAVISYRYWQENLAADPNVLGRALTVDGTSFQIVGVMPPAFYGVTLNDRTPDMWLPITMQPQAMMRPSLLKPDGLFWIDMMARRKADVPVKEVQAWATLEFQRFLTGREGGSLSELRKTEIKGSYIPIEPGGTGLSFLREDYQIPLTVLMIMVGVVLLIACANLANLLLAKATAREREFCARLALGSTRGRIVRQILVEALLLALAGGAAGLAVAFVATRILIRFIEGDKAHSALAAAPDVRVLLFTLATCFVTAILFGIAPALRGSRTDVTGALNASARTAGGTSARRGGLLPKALIVAQVTLSVALLTLAGLLLRTLGNLHTANLGMDRSHVLLLETNPKFAGYHPERLNALYDRILSRMNALPGVRSASLSGVPGIHRGSWGSPIDLDGRATPPNEDISTGLNRVSAGYFETLSIPLLRGRTIQAIDTADTTKSAVVNRTFAERYFAHGDAVGHNFTIGDPAAPGVWHIVGVVGDTRQSTPAEKPEPFAYLATTQLTGEDQYAYWIQMKSDGDPAKLANEARSALAEIDPNLPVLTLRTMDEWYDSMLQRQSFISELAGVFALLALLLACVGLYGVMTYNVARRTSELGVRMALGASRQTLVWMVLRESLTLLAVGVALGIPLSLGASRAIKAGLYGVSPFDPVTLAIAVVVICMCMLAGAYVPARRAAKVDPMVALRCE